MSAEEKQASRGTAATIVATAAVTVALGVTVAALGGYLGPRPDRAAEKTPAAEVTSNPPTPEATPAPNQRQVVLVPVTNQPPPPALEPAPDPDALLAATGPTYSSDDEEEEHDHDDDDDDHERREHRGRRDHDDD